MIHGLMAYAKFQNPFGDDYYVRNLPILIHSRSFKTKTKLHRLLLTDCVSPIQLVLYFQREQQSFKVLTGGPQCFINGQKCDSELNLSQDLQKLQSQGERFLSSLSSRAFTLQTMATLYFSDGKSSPEVYKFVLPLRDFLINDNIIVTPGAASSIKFVEKTINQKWSPDDRDQLKKFLLQYGYGRWRQIMRSSSAIGGKLQLKPKPQVRAYGNNFVRALAECLPEEQTDLKLFLLNMIQQKSEDPFVQSNVKEWDPYKILKARSVQYTKRLQLLFRVRTLIKRYQEEQFKVMAERDKQKIDYENLLNFIPIASLFGQRPAVWWSKKHDIDLILGVYKYGYTNYQVIKSAYNWQDANNPFNIYQEFPSADSLTRRLKKLMLTINKIQHNQGKIGFQQEVESDQEDKGWSANQKKVLFNLVSYFGVPVMQDNKFDWNELRERLKQRIKQKFDKPSTVVQKMVQRLRWTCQQIINSKKRDETKKKQGQFVITYSDALRFNKNTNILNYIRKINTNSDTPAELTKRSVELTPDHPAFIKNLEFRGEHDVQLLQFVKKNGFGTGIPEELKKRGISSQNIFERVQWICQILKLLKQKQVPVKKKPEVRGQKKYDVNRDSLGNIVFPIQINTSLKLLAIGRVIPSMQYHSQHNLFPVGFKTIRTHASTVFKGKKCDYTCQILEGDRKPIYKVTSQQDPHNPIIRDSSTGCWVYICNKVNDLQDVPKDKVTISGTERFGLLQPKVVRLLQDLQNAQKCTKYKFKYKTVTGEAVA